MSVATLFPQETLQCHEVIIYRGRVPYSLSSSCAFLQIPKVEELVLRAKKSNTLDPDHTYQCMLQASPGLLTLNLGAQNPRLLSSNPVIFMQMGEVQFIP